MKLLFKYATRGRPQWFKETLEKYYSMQSGRHEYQFIVSMDEDDPDMNTPEIRQYLNGKKGLTYFYGPNKSKIEAINANMGGVEFDILVVIADDMVPVVQGYDDVIVQDMLNYYPELDGCLHYNDGAHCKNIIIPLTIVGKRLYDRFGYIYWHEYKSMWCDNEFTDLVYGLEKAAWIDRVIIKNEFMKYGTDGIYEKNNTYWDIDKALYESRKKDCFPGGAYKEDVLILPGSDRSMCIVNFAKNGWYPLGQKRLTDAFRQQGYLGDFMLCDDEYKLSCRPHPLRRTLSEGCMPYEFKGTMIHLAKRKKYKTIFWADASIIPTKSFSSILDLFLENGYLFIDNGFLVGQWCGDSALKTLGVTREEVFQMKELTTCFWGLDLERLVCRTFVDEFYKRSYDGSFYGAWTNKNKEVSADERVMGHRHDQTAASVIAHKLGMNNFFQGLYSYEQDTAKHSPSVIVINKGGI